MIETVCELKYDGNTSNIYHCGTKTDARLNIFTAGLSRSIWRIGGERSRTVATSLHFKIGRLTTITIHLRAYR